MSSGFRKLIAFTLIIGVTAAGYQFMIRPANAHLTQSKARVQAKLAKLAEFEQATVAAEDLTKQLGQLEDAIRFFESRLPPSNEIHKVLEQVTLIAQKQGLHAKSIRTLEMKDNSGYVEQPLKMELQGNFRAFYCFLLELEKLQRITKVRELRLDKKTDAAGLIAADFIVSIFFQNQKN